MSAEPRPEVSVVVPLLDELATLPELLARLTRALEATERSFELVLVDDGSTDGTGAALRVAELEDPRLRVFELTRNFGQASALACGIFEARGDVVVTLDGDLQNPPEEIPRLLEVLDKGFDVASARRSQRYEGFARWLGSRAVHWLARYLTGARLDDFGGQFKAYRRAVVDGVRRCWTPGRPIFPLAIWLGYRVAEVSVRHEPRHSGSSRHTLRSLLRINVDLITGFTTLPLALVAIAGAAATAIGAVGLAACAVSGAGGWLAPAACLVALAVGGVWLAVGVLGQYLGRVYLQAGRGWPSFVVRRGPGAAGSREEAP